MFLNSWLSLWWTTILILITGHLPVFALAFGAPNANSKLYLAKTKETFKFADLQWLQAQLDAQSSRAHGEYQCQRLLLDSATGSSLFLVEISHGDWFEKDNKLPPSLARCEWMAEVLAQSTDAASLVQDLKARGGISVGGGWTLDYLRMTPVEKENNNNPPPALKYNSKTLLCAVAQQIRDPAVLDPSDDNHSEKLVLVETTTRQGLYLCRFLWRGGNSTISWNPPLSRWAKRPYQYSSAIHPTVAEIVVELVLSSVSVKDKGAPVVRLLDPTCGSGTFLAFALCRSSEKYNNVFVEGWDTNPRCVEGSKANLEYAFGEEGLASTNCEVTVRDSSFVRKEDELQQLPFDCLVANLPWGKNTVDYADQNEAILRSVRTRLRDDAICVFVHKSESISDSKSLRSLGYERLGEAFVPPQGFTLPQRSSSSKKKKKKRSSKKQLANESSEDDDAEGTNGDTIQNRCQRITVAKTIRKE